MNFVKVSISFTFSIKEDGLSLEILDCLKSESRMVISISSSVAGSNSESVTYSDSDMADDSFLLVAVSLHLLFAPLLFSI